MPYMSDQITHVKLIGYSDVKKSSQLFLNFNYKK